MTRSDDTVDDLPPSAKLVLKVLEYDGGLTQKRIVEESRLSQRTVRDALSRLRDADLVEESIYVPDARQSLYTLAIDEGGDDGTTADEVTSDGTTAADETAIDGTVADEAIEGSADRVQ